MAIPERVLKAARDDSKQLWEVTEWQGGVLVRIVTTEEYRYAAMVAADMRRAGFAAGIRPAVS
jgi:hypothetical protein